MNISLKKACTLASEELQIPLDEVERIYRAYWWSIRDNIQSLQLKGEVTEGYLKDKFISFNIPSLGKLYTSYERIKGVKKRFNLLKNLRNDKYKEDKASV